MNLKFFYCIILVKKILGGCRFSVMMYYFDILIFSKKKGDRNISNMSYFNIIVYIYKFV